MKVFLKKLTILAGYIVVLFVLPFFPHIHELYQVPLVLSILLAATLFLSQPLPKDEQKDSSIRVLKIAFIVTLMLPIIDFIYLKLNVDGNIWAGFGISLAGLILRNYSIWYLGKQFTSDVRIVEGHKLVDTGPYKYIRHPSYTGSLIMLLGNAIIYGSVLGIASLIFIMIPAFIYRIKREEDLLIEHFGDLYQDYIFKTRRFI